jgi:hypothetical protein
MAAGIYVLENKINGAKYVGQGVDVHRRMGRYHNDGTIGSALRYYGEMNFISYVLLYCEPWELDRYERECIRALRTYDSNYGYNMLLGRKFSWQEERIRLPVASKRQAIIAYLMENYTGDYIPGPSEVARALNISKGSTVFDAIREFREIRSSL